MAYHERGREDQTEVEQLRCRLPGVPQCAYHVDGVAVKERGDDGPKVRAAMFVDEKRYVGIDVSLVRPDGVATCRKASGTLRGGHRDKPMNCTCIEVGT